METRFDLYPDAKSKTSLEDGLEFQDFVCEQLLLKCGIVVQAYASRKRQYGSGESIQGIEIKNDNRCTGDKGEKPTGRLSIETAEKARAQNSNFVPSGIYREDNTWLYVQGNSHVLFVFAKNMLVMLHHALTSNGAPRYSRHELPTIRKFYLPLHVAEKYAAKLIVLDDDKYQAAKKIGELRNGHN